MSYSYECAYVSIPVNLYFTPTLHLAFTCIVFSAAAGVLAQLWWYLQHQWALSSVGELHQGENSSHFLNVVWGWRLFNQIHQLCAINTRLTQAAFAKLLPLPWIKLCLCAVVYYTKIYPASRLLLSLMDGATQCRSPNGSFEQRSWKNIRGKKKKAGIWECYD